MSDGLRGASSTLSDKLRCFSYYNCWLLRYFPSDISKFPSIGGNLFMARLLGGDIFSITICMSS